ncbi:zinc ribbon domain-containing protein [Fundicoccus culcitae]|uniref:Zinc ribbon domain-containing protein n=1 Tax=Fundicoccus culcitae TaxID=2969821 RepID=A0ABY5P7V7_9LACT|nr:zinc ribbon domain-containing protein [Fundicoccus culcitae]UUX34826.1 zinc ribbon domain-containing protein [Fundicoccus culcitae]
MGINMKNAEGYHDPTPHKTLSNITREEKAAAKAAFKPLVYICSPFSGDIENNNKRTRSFCRFALDKGNIPLAPHLLFPQFMDDSNEKERELARYALSGKIVCGECGRNYRRKTNYSVGRSYIASGISKTKRVAPCCSCEMGK